MTNEKYLMDVNTGVVDTYSAWLECFSNVFPDDWGGCSFEDAHLIEVNKNESGEWVEV